MHTHIIELSYAGFISEYININWFKVFDLLIECKGKNYFNFSIIEFDKSQFAPSVNNVIFLSLPLSHLKKKIDSKTSDTLWFFQNEAKTR